MIIQHNNTVLNFNVVTFLAKVINLSRLYHLLLARGFFLSTSQTQQRIPFHSVIIFRKNIYKTIVKDHCLFILNFTLLIVMSNLKNT